MEVHAIYPTRCVRNLITTNITFTINGAVCYTYVLKLIAVQLLRVIKR